MKITIEITGGNGDSRRCELAAGKHLFGRDPASDVALTGDGTEHVSWKHARLDLRNDGAYLEDLNSSNGTFLNDRKLVVETKILEGDNIRFGRNGPRVRVREVDIDFVETVIQSATSGPSDSPIDEAGPALDPASPEPPTWQSAGGTHSSEILPGGNPPAAPPARSSTRQLLVNLRESQRNWRIFGFVAIGMFLVGIVVVLIVLGGKLWDVGRGSDEANARIQEADERIRETDERNQKAIADAKKKAEEARKAALSKAKGTGVYQQTLKSTAWILSVKSRQGSRSTGTGSLVDRKRRLVVTNHHVVGKNRRATVLFPDFKEGEAISDRKHYVRKVAGILNKGNGTVLVNDPSHDIAVIQLDSEPKDVPALELVEASAKPGTRLHTVGNPGAGSALWSYSVGAVRQVAKVRIPKASGTFDGWTLETQNPINSGDSGGPVVNDDGKLVAINMASHNEARLVTLCVDIREIRKALKTARSRAKP